MKNIFYFVIILIFCMSCSDNRRGTLKIQMEPHSYTHVMNIYVDGKFVGETPPNAMSYFSINLRPGDYKIEIKRELSDFEKLYDMRNVTIVNETEQVIIMKQQTKLTELGLIAKKEREQRRTEEEKRKREAREQEAKEREAREREARERERKKYKDNEDGTVTNTENGLQWMRCSLGQDWDGSTCKGGAKAYSWNDALAAGKSHSFAGKSDWRVPTVEELNTLVYCSSGEHSGNRGSCQGNYQKPTLHTDVFPNSPSSFFWSSSPYDAWYLGYVFHDSKNMKNQLRLVRAGH